MKTADSTSVVVMITIAVLLGGCAERKCHFCRGTPPCGTPSSISEAHPSQKTMKCVFLVGDMDRCKREDNDGRTDMQLSIYETFIITLCQAFDHKKITSMEIIVDTDGLAYDKYACDHDSPRSCQDYLVLTDSKGRAKEQWSFHAKNGETTCGTITGGERHLVGATAVAEDGKIWLQVQPSHNEAYTVNYIKVTIDYSGDVSPSCNCQEITTQPSR